MTAFKLKLIAIITMIIDHIGLFFFYNDLIFRVVGRLSFPIFAWLIANGAVHTKNIKKYLVRLLILAVVSQPVVFLVDPFYDRINAVFTLFIGLVVIAIIQNIKNKFIWIFVIFLGCVASEVLRTDYGAMGVLSIVFFYIFFRNKKLMTLSQLVIYVFPYVRVFDFESFRFAASLRDFYEVFAVFALVLILLYNGKRGVGVRGVFYLIYPLQYVVIYLFQIILLGRDFFGFHFFPGVLSLWG